MDWTALLIPSCPCEKIELANWTNLLIEHSDKLLVLELQLMLQRALKKLFFFLAMNVLVPVLLSAEPVLSVHLWALKTCHLWLLISYNSITWGLWTSWLWISFWHIYLTTAELYTKSQLEVPRAMLTRQLQCPGLKLLLYLCQRWLTSRN